MSKLLLIFTLTLLFGCDDCAERELIRTKSPDGKYDALLVEQNCGGALGGSFDYVVLIVRNGKHNKYNYRKELVLRARRLEGESLNWITPNILEFKYKKARIEDFRNHIMENENDVVNEIEIRETPLTPPPSFEHVVLNVK